MHGNMESFCQIMMFFGYSNVKKKGEGKDSLVNVSGDSSCFLRNVEGYSTCTCGVPWLTFPVER